MKPIGKNVIIKMDVLQKEKYQLTKDVTIEIKRGFNFNLREDRASFGYVVNGANMPQGTMILCNYLALEPTYEIQNETILTDAEKEEGFKVFSIPKDMCFCYFENDEWKPCDNYLITKRIFKPYKGKLTGIQPEVVKNRMYVEKGIIEWEGDKEDLGGKVIVNLANADYQIIWHSPDHKEYSLIRTMDREVIALDNGLTEDLKKGKYLVGISPSDCEQLKI